MDKHFELDTINMLAATIVDDTIKGAKAGTEKAVMIQTAAYKLAGHIRKPSDDDKSVPERCEEAYNEALNLLGMAVDLFDNLNSKRGRTWAEMCRVFFNKPNPFKEADIVPDDVDVFMDLLEKEKQKIVDEDITEIELETSREREAIEFLREAAEMNSASKLFIKRDTQPAVEWANKVDAFLINDDPLRHIKPFSLEDAKNGAKVVTRGGTPVKIVSDNIDSEYPILYVGNKKNGKQFYNRTDINGIDKEGTDTNSIFILKEPKTVTVSIYQEGTGKIYAFNVEQQGLSANLGESLRLIKTIKTTI